MDDDKKTYLEEDLAEEDLAVLRLYEKAAEPVAWDEADDAILARAGSAGPAADDGDVTLIPGVNAPAPSPVQPDARKGEEQEAADSEGSGQDSGRVVAFEPRQKKFSVRRILQSPVAGFAMAASLVLGIFAGQGMTPYVDLGVGPDYRALQAENESLKQLSSQTRSLTITTTPKTPASGTSGQISDLERIAGLLSGFSCADLSLSVSQGRGVQIAGHVGSANDLRRLNAELRKMGPAGEVSRDVKVYGWPNCEVLEIFAPFVGGGLAGAGAPSLRLSDHGLDYAAGESLVVEAAASSRSGGYLYVDYFLHNGQVRHMLPTHNGPANRLEPGEGVILGESGLNHMISPPFGTELVVVLQSPLPLFGTARADVERAQDYLKTLRKALSGLVARGRGDEVFVAYVAITSHGDK